MEGGRTTPLTWREQFALRAEGCIEEMKLANIHMEEALNEFIHRILEEGRAATREKVAERIRAKLPEPQTKISDLKRIKDKEAELDAKCED